MSTTTNYLINLYRSLIIERDELKNQNEENKKNYYQMYKELYKEYYGLMVYLPQKENSLLSAM